MTLYTSSYVIFFFELIILLKIFELIISDYIFEEIGVPETIRNEYKKVYMNEVKSAANSN